MAAEPEKKTSKAAKAPAKPRAKRTSTKKKKIDNLDQIPCPRCGKGHLIKGNTAYGCSCFRDGCDFRLYFQDYPPTLTPQELFDKLNAQQQ